MRQIIGLLLLSNQFLGFEKWVSKMCFTVFLVKNKTIFFKGGHPQGTHLSKNL